MIRARPPWDIWVHFVRPDWCEATARAGQAVLCARAATAEDALARLHAILDSYESMLAPT